MPERHWIRQIVDDIVSGKLKPASATRRLLYEMGRGGRTLVVDENLYGLVARLTDLGFTAHGVQAQIADPRIKKELFNKVLITRNGRHFVKDQEKYHYGLIWITSNAPDIVLARKIDRLFVRGTGFKKNLLQTFKI